MKILIKGKKYGKLILVHTRSVFLQGLFFQRLIMRSKESMLEIKEDLNRLNNQGMEGKEEMNDLALELCVFKGIY